ncbi:MAG: tetrahydrofolate dehydrogenase/cyclohydrolase catalytic domain-containing protein [Clostridiales bacterium]|nr:bifunctional 5,10-methylene-tetrahydrofolate dehydrogenase/5,10-methylene-tetrahydrofolate cyclohydrolase [Eubacteriales bacterium]MDH7565657.1 tetrahydrofolate dehydrogenase/cyclohydrolase catalytic domain-containing protein [Clostridiales bacterium]
MAVVMKGSEVANAMKEKMIKEVEALKAKGIAPTLGIVRLGARPDDLAYEKGAVKRCETVGIGSKVFEYPEKITQAELIDEINKINADKTIHGILLFRPLPKHIDENVIKYVISPQKDIDCLNPVNVAKVFEGDESGFAPCTPTAVVEMLDFYNISLEGKRVVVVGRSLVVGKPLAMMLLKKNATVTICHTRTRNLQETCRNAEILIAAAGKAKMVTGDFIPKGGVVVDVGINLDENGNLCGDVDYQAAEGIASHITPVPGGVGTVTSSVLAKHVIKAASAF